MRISLFKAALMVTAAVCVGPVAAQDVSGRPIKITSPFATGTGPDFVARLLAEKLSKSLGQPVVVDARPGGSGFIAAEVVKRASPSGQDLLLVDNGHMAINPNLFRKLPYDVEKDFTPVGLLFTTPFYVVVSNNSPYRSVPELLKAAGSKSDYVSYGSPYIGSPSHLGGALLQSLTNTKMLHIPFKESSQLWTSVSTGEVTWGLGTKASTANLTSAGRLKFIAVARRTRDPAHPEVPTVGESGGPAGYEVSAWVGLMAPRATNAPALQRLSLAIQTALADPDLKDRMRDMGFDPQSSSPQELASLIKADTVKYANLVKLSGATID